MTVGRETSAKTVETLKTVLSRVLLDSPDPNVQAAAKTLQAQDQVRARYQPVFSPEGVKNLAADDFRGFLLPENNQHWSAIHRQGGLMTGDMPRLRGALGLLVDESVPIKQRLDRLRPKGGEPLVKGLARSVITAILHIAYPEKYGVVNNAAESGMRQLGVWPELPRGASFGEKYELINRVLCEVAEAIGTDLWTLDCLWWLALQRTPRSEDTKAADPRDQHREPAEVESGLAGPQAAFALERHLHEFLVDNWEKTDLAREWVLAEEDGDIVGSHYCAGDAGEIDILARHRDENRWLVVELKRNQTSDNTVGQVLRYMGWVRKNLLSEGGRVEGLIICPNVDRKLQYALDGLSAVECMTYQVSFTLNTAPSL
jgi:hypothetical protein